MIKQNENINININNTVEIKKKTLNDLTKEEIYKMKQEINDKIKNLDNFRTIKVVYSKKTNPEVMTFQILVRNYTLRLKKNNIRIKYVKNIKIPFRLELYDRRNVKLYYTNDYRRLLFIIKKVEFLNEEKSVKKEIQNKYLGIKNIKPKSVSVFKEKSKKKQTSIKSSKKKSKSKSKSSSSFTFSLNI